MVFDNDDEKPYEFICGPQGLRPQRGADNNDAQPGSHELKAKNRVGAGGHDLKLRACLLQIYCFAKNINLAHQKYMKIILKMEKCIIDGVDPPV